MNTERHPFTPFLPDGCRLLMLGSFPPGEQRWSMRFYYPNFTNDMWRIFGLCFYSDKLHFVDTEHKTFRLDLIVPFLNEHRIGMYDTATEVRRLKNTASDKDLEVVEPTDLKAMVDSLPELTDIVTTGQKATDTLRAVTGCDEPAVGGWVPMHFAGRDLKLWRMQLARLPHETRAQSRVLQQNVQRNISISIRL